MNSRTKKRLGIVTGIIVIVLVVVLAVVGSSGAAKTVSIAQALSGEYTDQKIQVTGSVVQNSYSTSNNTLVFEIYDTQDESAGVLPVQFEGAVSATFGNNVSAICTGKILSDGVLHATELVTKCPSKYESGTDALTVDRLLEYEDAIYDKPVKVEGVVKAGSLKPAGQGERFFLQTEDGAADIAVVFEDALPDEITDGTTLVITGSLDSGLTFTATDVALKG